MASVILRERKRKSGRVYLFLDIYHDGERKQESTGLYYSTQSKNKKDIKLKANELRKQREQQLDSGYIGKTKSEIDFILYFEDFIKSKGFKTANEPYICALKQLKKFIADKKIKTTFDRLEHNTKFFQEFVDYLLKQVAQNTAWAYFAKTKAVINNAIRERIILHSPVKYIKIGWQEVEKVYLTIEELNRLAKTECLYPQIKLAFLFSCYTGLRLSDIEKLRWGDIKRDPNGNLTLNFRQKKTGGIEYFPLNETAIKITNETIEDPKIIPHPESKIFPLFYIKKIEWTLKSWIKKATIQKHVTFHCGRHTFAVNSITSGVDIFTVSKLLGHRDLKTTLVYAKIVDSKLNEAVQKLPSLSL